MIRDKNKLGLPEWWEISLKMSIFNKPHFETINILVLVDAALQNTKLHFTINFLIHLKKFIIC